MPRPRKRRPGPRKVQKKSGHKKPVLCPFCGGQALLREGSFLFENPVIKKLYVCVRYPECDSYVAAHEDSLEPMGPLADAELRKKRLLAHQYFDQLWKPTCGSRAIFSRKQAYRWLCDKLGGNTRHNHIGLMGAGMCDRVIREAKKVLNMRKEIDGLSGGEASGA